MTEPTECPDCGVYMRPSNDGTIMCPYCNSWAFRDAVSDGAIYSAVSNNDANKTEKLPLESAFPTAIAAAQYLTKRAIEARALDHALRQWIERQNGQTTVALYQEACRYFGLSPVLPE